LRFLDAAGVSRTDLGFRVLIHENADVKAAERFWLRVTGASRWQFLTPTLKRHNPKTVRKNVGENYHGCLRVGVYGSANLYRKIEGWATASMAGSCSADLRSRSAADIGMPTQTGIVDSRP
jgi:hypothetical protein